MKQQTSNFLKGPSKPNRIKTQSVTNPTYKPSSVLIEMLPNYKRDTSAKLKTLFKKSDEERKTFKKICRNPSNYFKILSTECNTEELEHYLCLEFFRSPLKNSAFEGSRTENNESMEVIPLKNSSIHLSRVFNSIVFDNMPSVFTKVSDNIIYNENNSWEANNGKTVISLISQLDKAIQIADFDTITRCKLMDSLEVMRETLKSKKEPLTQSFTRYLSNKRPTLIHRN